MIYMPIILAIPVLVKRYLSYDLIVPALKMKKNRSDASATALLSSLIPKKVLLLIKNQVFLIFYIDKSIILLYNITYTTDLILNVSFDRW